MSEAEVWLSAINAVCNTVQVIGLAWIGAAVTRVGRNTERP